MALCFTAVLPWSVCFVNTLTWYLILNNSMPKTQLQGRFDAWDQPMTWIAKWRHWAKGEEGVEGKFCGHKTVTDSAISHSTSLGKKAARNINRSSFFSYIDNRCCIRVKSRCGCNTIISINLHFSFSPQRDTLCACQRRKEKKRICNVVQFLTTPWRHMN
jgi:hypothetical protein